MLVWKLKSWGHHFTQSWFFKERTSHAISLNAAASGRGGQRRVRSWRVQRQRHGTDPGDHGGGPGNPVAGDRAGEPRRSRLFAGSISILAVLDAGPGGAEPGLPEIATRAVQFPGSGLPAAPRASQREQEAPFTVEIVDAMRLVPRSDIPDMPRSRAGLP